MHLVLEPLDVPVPLTVGVPVGPARERRNGPRRRGGRRGGGRRRGRGGRGGRRGRGRVTDSDVTDAPGSCVRVRTQSEDRAALPRLPSALAVENQRARILLGLRGAVRVAGTADAAPRGQVELIRAVVPVP